MFIKIIGIFAEFERENIGERIRLGIERKAKEGYTTAIFIPSYGYDRETGERIQTINEKEAEIVRRIFDMFVNQNMNLTAIARTLNKEKIPTKQDSIWRSSTVASVLKNINLIGYVRCCIGQSERYFEAAGKHEPIISKELFDEVQLLLEKNKGATPTKKANTKNYFVGVLKCGLCGTRLTTKMIKKKGGHYLCNFRCDKRSVGACTAKMVSVNKIEKAVIDYFNNIPETVIDNTKEIEIENKKAKTAARIAELQDKISVFDEKEKEVLDSYVVGDFSLNEYRDSKRILDSQKNELLEEIKKLTPTEKKTESLKSKEEIIQCFKNEWCDFNDIEKRQFLLKYIKSISLINHSVQGTLEGNCEITDIEFNT